MTAADDRTEALDAITSALDRAAYHVDRLRRRLGESPRFARPEEAAPLAHEVTLLVQHLTELRIAEAQLGPLVSRDPAPAGEPPADVVRAYEAWLAASPDTPGDENVALYTAYGRAWSAWWHEETEAAEAWVVDHDAGFRPAGS